MDREKDLFTGSWKLKEWSAELRDESNLHPFGKDAIGRITYGNDGLMAVQIMKNNRAPFKLEDPLQGQPDEMITAFNAHSTWRIPFRVSLMR
ncbi:MAG: lipocalin-like domain-containing protein [Cyclobacteriaceae bacterium]